MLSLRCLSYTNQFHLEKKRNMIRSQENWSEINSNNEDIARISSITALLQMLQHYHYFKVQINGKRVYISSFKKRKDKPPACNYQYWAFNHPTLSNKTTTWASGFSMCASPHKQCIILSASHVCTQNTSKELCISFVGIYTILRYASSKKKPTLPADLICNHCIFLYQTFLSMNKVSQKQA